MELPACSKPAKKKILKSTKTTIANVRSFSSFVRGTFSNELSFALQEGAFPTSPR